MPKVSAATVVERERRAWDLSIAGRSQEHIAEQLGLTQQAVSKILKRVSARVLKELEGAVAQRKAIQDRRLEQIYAEAIDAWDSSKKPRKKSRSKKLVVGLTAQQLAHMPDGKALVGGVPHTVREETTNEASLCDGNFLFLQTALQALDARAKLWGLYAPKKVDLVDQRRPLEKLTDEELLARARENAALLAAENGD